MSKLATFAILLSLACAWFCNKASAQVQHDQSQQGLPGVRYGGRVLGYVPAHLKGQTEVEQLGSPSHPVRVQPLESGTELEETVILTSFQQGIDDEAPAPPMASHVDGVPIYSAAPISSIVMDAGVQEICCGTPWIWGRAEYLLWWTKGMYVPALATTSPDGTLQGQAGVLGEPDTAVLFGDTRLNSEARSGGRYTLGMWLDPCRFNGLGVTYLGLGEQSETFSSSGDDVSILARPFFNLDPANLGQDARLIAYPGVIAGTLDIVATTEFQTFELLYRRVAVRSCNSRVDCFVGYRFAELQDRVSIDELTVSGDPTNATISLFDQFDTRNTFHGAEFGIGIQRQMCPCWSWELLAKVAIGGTNLRGNVAGQTITTTDAGTTTTQGGLLAQTTNMGAHSQSEFSAISELGISVRRQFRCGLTATFGYTFLSWNDVYRVGDQIDLDVNTTQIPPRTLTGEARPVFPFDSTGFWAHGMHFGLEYLF